MASARTKVKKITTKRTATPKVRPHAEHPVATTKPLVYVLSDSTGNLARHMLAAFQTQFPPNSLTVHYETFIRTEARLKQVLEKAKAHHAIVCHAIVSPELKVLIADWCKEHDLPCRD